MYQACTIASLQQAGFFLLLLLPCMAPSRLVAGFHYWQNAKPMLLKSTFHATEKCLIQWHVMQWITRIHRVFSLEKSVKIGKVHVSSKTENMGFFSMLGTVVNKYTVS